VLLTTKLNVNPADGDGIVIAHPLVEFKLIKSPE
jgi:hypothetical protein